MGLLRHACELEDPADGPGLVLLDASGALAGTNDAVGRWLQALGGRADGSDLPVEISAVAVRLRQLVPGESALPRLRVRTASGRWAMLHASWMNTEHDGTIAVIIEQAAPADVVPMITLAYGLTKRERTITALVCHDLSTRQIADKCWPANARSKSSTRVPDLPEHGPAERGEITDCADLGIVPTPDQWIAYVS